VERFENGSDVCGYRSLNNSTSKIILDLLKPVKLTVWKVLIESVTVVKFRMNDRGGTKHTKLMAITLSILNRFSRELNFQQNPYIASNSTFSVLLTYYLVAGFIRLYRVLSTLRPLNHYIRTEC